MIQNMRLFLDIVIYSIITHASGVLECPADMGRWNSFFFLMMPGLEKLSGPGAPADPGRRGIVAPPGLPGDEMKLGRPVK